MSFLARLFRRFLSAPQHAPATPPHRRRAAIAIVENGKLLLIHRLRDGKEYHVLPGGNIRAGETPAMACVRETREETGLNVWLDGELCVLNGEGRIDHVFRARKHAGTLRLGGPELAKMGPHNQYRLVWVNRSELDAVKLKPKGLKRHCLALLDD